MQKIAKKLLNIYKEIGSLEKQGKNTGQNYSYFTEAQIASKLQGLFEKNGIVVFTSTDSFETKDYPKIKDGVQIGVQFMTHVKTCHRMIDVDSGEEITLYSCGSGADPGDKGMYKAITGSFKYFLMKNAFISDNQDPENDADEAKEKLKSLIDSGKLKPASKAKSDPVVEVKRAGMVDNKYLKDKKFIPSKTVFHFGKNKGKLLSELSEQDLQYWAVNWIPKPFEGNFSEDDLKLDAALTLWTKNGGKWNGN